MTGRIESSGDVQVSTSQQRMSRVSLSTCNFTQLQLRVATPILAGQDLHVNAISAFDTKFHRAAFVSILRLLDPSVTAVQALILAPARDQAQRIYTEIRREDFPGFRAHLCIGGTSVRETYELLTKPGQHGAVHIIIGTVGRVEDLIRREILKVDQLKVVFVDELDDIFGFRDLGLPLRSLFAALHRERLQKIFFTITLIPESRKFCEQMLAKEHTMLRVGRDELRGDE
ncbi:DEAD-box ATP-dependent RNA helicase [Mycena indigotica]|uniref:DEAD-box ATP-dependent RNA helicase n=1 Tax=Mycena indigotica TaxID=2126181 RepID=A0A8H6SQN3_9AGAR|nr:DEAD-box ATP-dependent RNA helicase [Mycena indigotica]KAF7303649.1 DEAD-box ATP-dependent RNA helicase [Mycena indigotica]